MLHKNPFKANRFFSVSAKLLLIGFYFRQESRSYSVLGRYHLKLLAVVKLLVLSETQMQ